MWENFFGAFIRSFVLGQHSQQCMPEILCRDISTVKVVGGLEVGEIFDILMEGNLPYFGDGRRLFAYHHVNCCFPLSGFVVQKLLFKEEETFV